MTLPPDTSSGTTEHLPFWNREANGWCCEEHAKYRAQGDDDLSASLRDEARPVDASTHRLSERDITALVYVASRADGGCSNCAAGIADGLAEFFPGPDWRALVRAEMDKPYEERFDANDEPRGPFTPRARAGESR